MMEPANVTPSLPTVASKRRRRCCSKLKMFLMALSFAYFAKAFQGSYMKSSITQIERRFNIPSSLIGLIDGSFEMGNLLVIAFVSYFGAKLHRPKLIGAGCLLMALGSFVTAIPHFIMGKYEHETSIAHSVNLTTDILPCQSNQAITSDEAANSEISVAECQKEASSSMWIYVFLGNMLRGIGETPVMPLGVSYVDDFAREENTAFYLGTVTINLKDSRWVGAWWLGFLVAGIVMLLASIPFWFLPRSLPKQGGGKKNNSTQEEKRGSKTKKQEHAVDFSQMTKDFLPSLKSLFCNPVFFCILCVSVIQVNAFIGLITFKPKFIEQTYGQSPSKAVFLIGILHLPAVALGIFTGGFVLKKLKLTVIGAARVTIGASFISFLLSLSYYGLSCENAKVAGLTVSYEGLSNVSYQENTLLSQCNSECACSVKYWDPVCADNGMTFVSPCLAGCKTSTGTGKQMVFHNCSCVAMGAESKNTSVVLGQCARGEDCGTMFTYYLVVSVIGAYISACGATPGTIILLRSINPELKSLALGILTFVIRTLGGIPSPIYFGALIDMTCLKWGSDKCGGRGACRMYDSNAFKAIFLGLIYGLYCLSYLLWFVLYTLLKRRFQENQTDNMSEDEGKANLKETEDTGSHKDCHEIMPKEEDLLERESGI
ncbi:solute carrier organic anion transporter family member 1C1-like isoform X2 [Polyodon spathula]|uniref:solute carrier organic anion transporter family member 1C1-like isoform X2 n=1 Tax=Polyodon spathula TaxID=7913 RepID=UPI001B7DC9F3|nr:solute carrier organic anion transporter family member 1C1-like isoform X2 [Polyodon spathula]